ncbi:MAG: hypothetical protein GXP29_05285 [Planctomycetes bacterium]|nr:hypothetical protein [Planctomycetota bacterium]
MRTKQKLRLHRVTAALAAGCLWANGGCLPDNFAASLVGTSANRLSNFLLDTFVIEPIEDAVSASRDPA